jgi:hypothetical protein
VKLLLADKRVDPSARSQHAIRLASDHGRVEVVKLLLADKRVDPSACDQYSIGSSSRYGHAEIVKLLLTDKRVDPVAHNQYAIRWSCANAFAQVVKLLLADQRVSISGLACPPSYNPEVLALCLLRRSYRREVLEAKPKPQALQVRSVPFIVADIEKIESQRKALLNAHLVSDLSDLCLAYVPDLFYHLDGKISLLFETNRKAGTRFPRFSFDSLSTL